MNRCVPRLVEEQAAIRPEALAVATTDCAINYGELNHRSAALADELRSCGVGRDVVVALRIKSSIAMVIGALGVLKAGAAYLPLDLSFPEQRLSSILNEAQPMVILTTRQSNGSIPSIPYGPWKTIQLEEDGRITATRTRRPESAIQPAESAAKAGFHDLAYVIYTSGSTGEPKGVEIEQRSLLNLVDWHNRTFSITSDDRASQIAGPAFDAAVWEIWPYLTAGASLHIPDESVRTDPVALRDWLIAQQITIGFAPTAMAERIMKLDWPDNTKLRTLLTGADTLNRFPSPGLPFKLVNNYGPTECTVVATSCLVPAIEDQNERPAIGIPITNTHIYILNEQSKPVPMGMPGELYVAGAGVARGYRNRPDLTASRFVVDPFVKDAEARMYRTGDLARMRPDGQISFLGRVDDQIKIRGYRIEPTEISAALSRHPAISQSAVTVQELADGEKRLIAYIVPSNDEDLTRSRLQAFLRIYIPEYMTPSIFVRVTSLPLTPNGKVDRERLPQPTPQNTIQDGSFEAPRTVVEERVTALLADLLESERIGIHDNFFHLGGHSLLGAQVIARVREVFEVELSLRTLFDNPTVEGIAAEIERLILAKLETTDNEEERANLARELHGTAA